MKNCSTATFFLADLLSLAVSIGLAWLVTAGLLDKMHDFHRDQVVEACFLLLLSYILTFLPLTRAKTS